MSLSCVSVSFVVVAQVPRWLIRRTGTDFAVVELNLVRVC